MNKQPSSTCANSAAPLAENDEFSQQLDRHARRSAFAWFPACVDLQCGGFLCNFNSTWQPTGPHDKMLEFQARQTRSAAFVYRFIVENAAFKAYVEHGFRFLRDVMWDDQNGGWYRLVSRQGQPMDYGIKHLHGTAYGISACVNYFRVTGDPEGMALAMSAFHWWDKRALDQDDAGYFHLCNRQGRLIRSPGDHPASGAQCDHMGLPIECRDPNSNADFLEALADLYAVTADPLVLDRLGQQYTLVRKRIIVDPGVIFAQYRADWRPVPGTASPGLSLQTAMQLLKASRYLENDNEKNETNNLYFLSLTADQVIRSIWDPEHGGVFLKPGSKQNETDGRKTWWHQAEALRVLAVLARCKDGEKYTPYLFKQWRYIERYINDPDCGIWDEYGRDGNAQSNDKAHVWKDFSHEIRALIEARQTCLTGQPALT